MKTKQPQTTAQSNLPNFVITLLQAPFLITALGVLSASAIGRLLLNWYVTEGITYKLILGSILFCFSNIHTLLMYPRLLKGQINYPIPSLRFVTIFVHLSLLGLIINSIKDDANLIILTISAFFIQLNFVYYFASKLGYVLGLGLTALIIFLSATTYPTFVRIDFVLMACGVMIFTHLLYKIFLGISKNNAQLTLLNQQIAIQSASAERQRIEIDLHDMLGHQLTALNFEIAMLEMKPPSEQLSALPEIRSGVRKINQLLRDVIANEHIQYQLSVQDIVKLNISRVSQLQVVLNQPPAPIYIKEATQRVLIQGVLECLTNCMKYAQNQTINIDIKKQNQHCAIIISNQVLLLSGAVDDVSSQKGLVFLAQQLNNIGGQLTIRQDTNKFSVELILPIASAE